MGARASSEARPVSRTPRPTRWPTPCGKNSVAAPLSTSVSGEPRRALAATGGDQRHELLEAGARRLRGRSHARELDVVLGAAYADERVAQLAVGVGGRAEPAHGPRGDPRLELAQRARPFGHAFAVTLEPAPQQLVGADRRDELDPAVGGRVGQHAAGALAVCQVEVLGVHAERVAAVGAPRHGNLVAGSDEHDAAVEVPRRRGRRSPAFEEGVRHGHYASAATPMRRLYRRVTAGQHGRRVARSEAVAREHPTPRSRATRREGFGGLKPKGF
jgi:hypothetical protein